MRFLLSFIPLGSVILMTFFSDIQQVEGKTLGELKAPVSQVYEAGPTTNISDVYSQYVPQVYPQNVPQVYSPEIPDVYLDEVPDVYSPNGSEVYQTINETVYGRAQSKRESEIATLVLKAVISCAEKLLYGSELGDSSRLDGADHAGRSDSSPVAEVQRVHSVGTVNGLVESRAGGSGGVLAPAAGPLLEKLGPISGILRSLQMALLGGVETIVPEDALNGLFGQVTNGLGQRAHVEPMHMEGQKGQLFSRSAPHNGGNPWHGSRSYDSIQTYANPSPYEAYTYTAPNPVAASDSYPSYPLNYVSGYSNPSTPYYGNFYNPSTSGKFGYGYPLNSFASNVGQQRYR